MMTVDEASSGLPRRTGPFGPASELLPKGQSLECLRPDDSLLIALERLCDAGFNQAPVKDERECYGVLRLFRVVQHLLSEPWFRQKVQNIPVGNCVELNTRYIGLRDWVDVDFDWEGDDIALVGTRTELHGMLTATDILRRLTDYAQAFVHLEAIELDTRAMLDLLIPLPENLNMVSAALTTDGMYPPRDFHSYTQLEYGHYCLLFGRDATFLRLKPACIWDRRKLVERFNAVGGIRNKLLHFRGRATAKDVNDLEQLARHAALAVERARGLANCVAVGAMGVPMSDGVG